MKKITLLTISIIFCYAISSSAAEDEIGAKNFIDEFLKAEYDGDNFFRVNNAKYSPKRKLWVKKTYGPMIGEIFQMDGDHLCVIEDYKIINIKIIKSKAFVDVTFQEFACTGSKGYGDIPLIITNKSSSEKYNLQYQDGRWWIKDPPRPRVSRKAIIDHNEQIIKRMSEWILKKGSKVQKEYYYNLINTNAMLKESTNLENQTQK